MAIRPFLESAVTEEIIESADAGAYGNTPVQNEKQETEEKEFRKADLLNRFLAKFIDFLIIGALGTAIKAPVGSMAALTYSLIADGFFDGRSLGKKLIGLKVVNLKTGLPCNFKDSILRNIPIGLIALFVFFIPILGLILFFTVGLVVLLFESYLIYTDDGGIRIGDIFADTQVVDDK